MQIEELSSGCPCESKFLTTVFSYDHPPAGETRFEFGSAKQYRRKLMRCGLCGHYLSVHEMHDGELYQGEYVKATYGNAGLVAAYERVLSLAPSSSDNVGRVRRILEFTGRHLSKPVQQGRPPAVLDVGSGLCVFLHGMKEAGWECTAIDPDPRAVEHARQRVGVDALCGDFLIAEGLGRFDLVTFNKVLEHVANPVSMLARSARFLDDRGFVYVEVPDGEAAFEESPHREEFFIEHHHVFSSASLALMSNRAGFRVCTLERLREPSTKFTLRAFLTRVGGEVGYRRI